MGVRKQVKKPVSELNDGIKDNEKMYFLYFKRMFSMEEIEHYFKGKYTYNEVRNIIRTKRREYTGGEIVNGR